jgi:hypothetical protein
MATHGTVRVKYSFSRQHLAAARHFAAEASRIEAAATPVPEVQEAEHRAHVTAAVMLSVAALEASINELYHEVFSKEQKSLQHFDDRAVRLMIETWRDTERLPILEKYQRVLLYAGLANFDRSREPFQSTETLIRLRDNLVHYRPEWSDEQGRHHSLEQRLRNRFSLTTGPHGRLWFPHQCLSAGCANWAINIAVDFTMDFCNRLQLPVRLP